MKRLQKNGFDKHDENQHDAMEVEIAGHKKNQEEKSKKNKSSRDFVMRM